MAVTTDFQQLRSELIVKQYDFDPGGTSAVDVGWVDAQEFGGVLISFFRTVGTSALTFLIVGNTEADGSGTDTTIKTITPDAAPDAVGDYVFGEVTQNEILQAAEDAGVEIRGVSAVLTFATGTDEGVVTYVIKPRHTVKDNTVDVVA